MPHDSVLGFLAKKDSTTDLIALVRKKSESFWLREGERRALERFHRAAQTVPAYKKFLKQHSVKSADIKTIEDFACLPTTDKKNYIEKFSLKERSPGGSLAAHRIIAASSGTVGPPMLWPRGEEQETEAAAVHEFLFCDLYELDRYPTLLVIGFPMGMYVSGVASAIPSFFAGIRHPNLTIVTAGNNKESILGILPTLQKKYAQIILAGHPFFVKDVIETGAREGIRWSKTKVRTFFVSEGFSEEWRRYLGSKLSKIQSARNLFSMYGSSELLLMGYESPESILIRSAAEKNSRFHQSIFKSARTPSLFHYNPALRYIENSRKGNLLFTAWSGIPLIRFDLHDAGRVITRSEMQEALVSERIRLRKDLKKCGWRPWNLPYVALFGRSDYTLVFYAANIYPEHIHAALNSKEFLKKITGKFSMEKKYTPSMDERLIIHVELQERQRGSGNLQTEIKKKVVDALERVNMEYRFLRHNLDKDLVPKVALHPYRDSEYFKAGVKPRYIIS
ncbi:MAG: hypothetical protein Q7R74_01785 [bacterium]|nr:hypothetical protein [bacterium]